jgi:type III pantothenate kinase
VASVNPPALHRFVAWSYHHGGTAAFEDYTQLPIRVNVDEPAKVGLDRLFGAVAAKATVPMGTPAITVDVGTAATVNLIDADGAFQGGAILPGPRLMARSLHEFTAKLPLVEPAIPATGPPGKNTTDAIQHGISNALVGGVHALVSLMADTCPRPPWLFLTGGAHHLLDGYRSERVERAIAVPTLTLDGIRIAAGEMP